MCPTSVSEAFGSNLNISLKQGSCNTYETYQSLIFWKPDFCFEIYMWKQKASIWHFRLCVVFLLFDLLVTFASIGESQVIIWYTALKVFFFYLFVSQCLTPRHTCEIYTSLRCHTPLVIIFRGWIRN